MFHKKQGTVWKIAVNNYNNPEEFLREVIKCMKEIPNEKEFEEFKKSLWIIENAAINHPNTKYKPDNTREFLRMIQKVTNEILEEEEFAGFKKRRRTVLRAATHNPSDPRERLRTLIKETAA